MPNATWNLVVPPMAHVVLLGERGDFGRSPIYGSSRTSLRLSLLIAGVPDVMHKEELRIKCWLGLVFPPFFCLCDARFFAARERFF
jgi:hypothetical protein